MNDALNLVSVKCALRSGAWILLPCLMLALGPARADAAVYQNTTPINAGSAIVGPSPYPSVINVSQLSGEITTVTVTLLNIIHPNPDDLDVLLLGPSGRTVLLMSDAGGTPNVTNVTVTFADTARSSISDAGPLTGGVYLPSNYDTADAFPNAPQPPYGSKLSLFRGDNPNGAWRLYVRDDQIQANAGGLAGGWRLTINTSNRAPVITMPLLDQRVPIGGNVQFKVGVDGTPPFGFQWLFNGAVLVPFGQGTDTLQLFEVKPDQEGVYTVQVTNAVAASPAVPFVQSQARLDVIDPLRITEELPASIETQPGGVVSLNIKVAGDGPIRYQWLRNGMVVTNAIGPTIRLTEVSPFDAGHYSIIAWNGVETVRSGPTHLRILFENAPSPRDFFQERPRLTGVSGVAVGDSKSASAERGETLLPGAAGMTTWMEITAPESGIMTVRTRGSTFDTTLAVYTGSDLRELRPLTSDDDRGGYYTSELQFNARRGEPYQIQIDGIGREGYGPLTLSWNLEATSARVPVLLRPIEPQVVSPGTDATFRAVTGADDESYQWFFLRAPYDKLEPLENETGPTLTIRRATSRDVGYYAVSIRSKSGRAILAPAVPLQLGSLPYYVGDKVQTMMFISGGGTFLPFGLGNSVNNTLPSAANRAEGDPDPCGSPFFGTLWLGLAATNNGTIQVETTGSTIPTRMAVYQLIGDITDFSAPAMICDLSSATNGLPCVASFDGLEGTNYTVVVEGYELSGNITLTAQMGAAPPLTNTLKHCLVAEGGSVVLEMPANTWAPVPFCQWRSNGVDILGATGTTLSISGFTAGDVGTYSVFISNFVSSTVRDVAYLELAPPFELHPTWVPAGPATYWIVASNAAPFVLETTTDLGGGWTPVATNPDPCLILYFTNSVPLADPRRFYRAVPWTP